MILVDPRKIVERLGQHHPIPVEVVPFAWEAVAHRIAELGAVPQRRIGGDGVPFLSDNGNEILDLQWPAGVADPAATAIALKRITGVVDSGLFVRLATRVLVGHADGHVEERRPPR